MTEFMVPVEWILGGDLKIDEVENVQEYIRYREYGVHIQGKLSVQTRDKDQCVWITCAKYHRDPNLLCR